MELLFLAILVLTMVVALTSGFPVAFALPGSAIITIALAAFCGYFFAGSADAYFIEGGPVQWINAGITNFRSVYWNVERDTLIAIPLFIFMGIMLQRSKIAEDLLVAMAQMFGPVPGGLGISVVLVGALLAATTGIVGATVIAMGMISLPAMLRNNYSHSLSTGTICASGTLGQIIPPSIVLIILADQLASAADQASNLRAADYRAATGEFSMPSTLDVTSTSAGDMFMGAIIPGLLLVGLYILYILITALINPKKAPPVPYEGSYNRTFFLMVFKALFPPLALIILVLGSILLGVATVNQAGSVGAIGAILMGGYRLYEGRNRYLPILLTGIGLLAVTLCLSIWDLNIKSISGPGEMAGIVIAALGVAVLMIGILWSLVRVHRIDQTLLGVMRETVKTSSMVFIILIGAAMLTAAFRAFGGEELVRHFLTGLPGGFWTQFIVVMLVIFILGFFLDFIEIAVVIVPLVAPILLAAPDANVTAVWLGVMVGMNLQTSFLTPPFGFALFYLRGVAPKIVKTLSIYKGVVPFIGLQILALIIVGLMPPLVNYLPNRNFLLSENAPPPMNPKLQYCMEEDLFEFYEENEEELRRAASDLRSQNLALLPQEYREGLEEGLDQMLNTFAMVETVRQAEARIDELAKEYRPTHTAVRDIERELARLTAEVEEKNEAILNERYSENPREKRMANLEEDIEHIRAEMDELRNDMPEGWRDQRSAFQTVSREAMTTRFQYRNNVDSAYEPVRELLDVLNATEALAAEEEALMALESALADSDNEAAMARIESVEDRMGEIEGAGDIRSNLARARRALRGGEPDRVKARQEYEEARAAYASELTWRREAVAQLLPALTEYHETIQYNIGLRQQARLPKGQALAVARCLSHHEDVSLSF